MLAHENSLQNPSAAGYEYDPVQFIDVRAGTGGGSGSVAY